MRNNAHAYVVAIQMLSFLWKKNRWAFNIFNQWH